MWIEFHDIHKHYGSVKANNGISFKVAPGSIHGILGENGFKDRLTQLCRRLNFTLAPEAAVGRLTVGEWQQLEIMRLLSLGCRVLILDEPTAGHLKSRANGAV